MKDKDVNKLLEDFANDSSICVGGKIKVTVTDHTTGFTPADIKLGTMRSEDCIYLDRQLSGAKALLYYLSRNGYKITKGKKK